MSISQTSENSKESGSQTKEGRQRHSKSQLLRRLDLWCDNEPVLQEKKIAAFANFHDVSIPTMANSY